MDILKQEYTLTLSKRGGMNTINLNYECAVMSCIIEVVTNAYKTGAYFNPSALDNLPFLNYEEIKAKSRALLGHPIANNWDEMLATLPKS